MMRIDFNVPTERDHDHRLEKIRASIEAGDYVVDLDQLASRIVDREMTRTRKLRRSGLHTGT